MAGPDLPWGGKLTLIVLMLAGRLEIVPVLVFIANFRRRGSGASGNGRKT